MIVLNIQIPTGAEVDLVARAREVLADLEQGLSDTEVLELFTKRYLSVQGAKVAGQKANATFNKDDRLAAINQAQEKAKDTWSST